MRYFKFPRLFTTLALLTICTMPLAVSAQFEDAEGVHKVVKDAPVIPRQDLVDGMKGEKLSPFMANDLDGVERFSGSFKGNALLLFFWKESCQSCHDLADRLSFLNRELPSLQILGLYDEKKAEFLNHHENQKPDFPTIANAKFISDGLYLPELGYPRIFLVDSEGLIQDILTEDDLIGSVDDSFSRILASAKKL